MEKTEENTMDNLKKIKYTGRVLLRLQQVQFIKGNFLKINNTAKEFILIEMVKNKSKFGKMEN